MEQGSHNDMFSRGVTRPMMDNKGEDGNKNKEEMKMSMDDRKELLHNHHMQMLLCVLDHHFI